jgi:dihydroneopterin aldolase
MKDNITIEILNARFHAYHGYYEEEKNAGNEFEVDARVIIDPSGILTGINETVNYVTLFEIIEKEMQEPRELLETLVMEMAGKVHNAFPAIQKVTISITKLNPPIYGFSGKVRVLYEKEF